MRVRVIGVVHLPPLPGSPMWGGEGLNEIIEYATREAKKLEEGGVDGVIVENYGDKPYRVRVGYETVAFMTKIVSEVKKAISLEVGVSLLRNSAPEAIAVAYASGATFIRSNQWCWTSDAPEGLLTPVAREGIELIAKLRADIKVIADVRVKHAAPVSSRGLCDEARDLAGRCLASALAVSGSATGRAPSLEAVRTVKECGGKEVYVASGVNLENAKHFASFVNGFIVGTFFKKGSITENEIEVERVKTFVRALRELQQEPK